MGMRDRESFRQLILEQVLKVNLSWTGRCGAGWGDHSRAGQVGVVKRRGRSEVGETSRRP